MSSHHSHSGKTASSRSNNRIALLLLLMFVSYQTSITLLGHFHMVHSSLMVQAHLYDNPLHEHSDGQFYTLASVSNPVGITPVQTTLQAAVSDIQILHTVCREIGAPLSAKTHNHHLRVPPAVSIIFA